MAQLKVTQVRSVIGTKRNHRESLRTLGLRKIRQSTVREDTPEVRDPEHVPEASEHCELPRA